MFEPLLATGIHQDQTVMGQLELVGPDPRIPPSLAVLIVILLKSRIGHLSFSKSECPRGPETERGDGSMRTKVGELVCVPSDGRGCSVVSVRPAYIPSPLTGVFERMARST